MISELAVFVFLPGETEPVPAGLLELDEQGTTVLGSSFVYGRRYLDRANRLEIDPAGLSLAPGRTVLDTRLFPPQGLTLFGGIRDAAPDAWGRQVIENKLRAPAGSLPESQYLLHAGANRAGALDIRAGLRAPVLPEATASVHRIERLMQAAQAIEEGTPVPADVYEIFGVGPTFGGMRPKAAVEDEAGRQWVAKFNSLGDRGFSIPVIEYATLRLAAECGLDVPQVRLVQVGAGRAALLVERFDRAPGPRGMTRVHQISALTLLAVDEFQSPEMSYADIAAQQARHGAPGTVKAQQAELFARMVFNIFVSNDDDHLRNFAFLWKDGGWVLSPLFDVVPRASLASERFLHLGIGAEGRAATLRNAMSRHARFGLDRQQALERVARIAEVTGRWRDLFEQWGIPGQDAELAAPAFRRAQDIGARDIGL